MEKLKIIIAEDDDQSRTVIRRFLETLPYNEIVGEAIDGEELIRQVIIEEPNIVLLDINMPKLNGIDSIKECIKILPELKVIIISGHSEFAIDAFDFSAVDFLTKPVDRTRLHQAIEKARYIIKMKNEEELKEFLKLKMREEKMVINAEGMIYFLSLKEILFFEKVGRKTLIHTMNKKYEVVETLGSLFKRLDISNFFQTHRSYIINFERVSSIKPSGDTNLVYFKDYKESAYISKSKMNVLQKFLKKVVN